MSKRSRGSIRRRGAAAAGVAAFAGLFIVVTAVPAFAHTAPVTGSSVCSDGAHMITWTIGSADTLLPMHVASATATLDGSQQFPVIGAVGMDVPDNTTITASTTVPGNLTGTVVLAVHGTWSDGATTDATTSVSLTSECTPGDTSTTSTTGATTSTTEATTSTTVESATSTTAPTTSSTIESSTTVASSTTVSSTPISGEGSTVQTSTTVRSGDLGSTSPSTSSPTAVTSTATGNLPFTGSSDSGPIFGLTSLVAGAFALVIARRRHSAR